MNEAAAWRVVGRGILLVAAIVLLALLVSELRSVIVQLLLAVLLAAAATPIVDGLTGHAQSRRWRWRPGRALAASAVFLGALMLLVLGAVAIAATVAPDLDDLTASLPAYVGALELALDDLVARNPDLSSRLRGALWSSAEETNSAAVPP